MIELQHEEDFRKETGTTGVEAYSKYLENYYKWLQKKYTELKAIQVQAKVKVNFAKLKEEFEEQFTVEEESTLFDIPKYRRLTRSNPDDLWKWFEQRLKEKISKISA